MKVLILPIVPHVRLSLGVVPLPPTVVSVLSLRHLLVRVCLLRSSLTEEIGFTMEKQQETGEGVDDLKSGDSATATAALPDQEEEFLRRFSSLFSGRADREDSSIEAPLELVS